MATEQNTPTTPNATSVTDFDREDVRTWEDRYVRDLTTEDLLKIVTRRGEVEKNPVVATDTLRTLKKINLEPFTTEDRGGRQRRNRSGAERRRRKRERERQEQGQEQNEDGETETRQERRERKRQERREEKERRQEERQEQREEAPEPVPVPADE